MQFIDTHSHIYLDAFDDDIEAVIERAKGIGLTAILLPNIDSESIGPMNRLTAQHPQFLFPMIGLHPTSVKENFRDELQIVRKELESGNYLAVGEIGIDLYWDKSFRHEQMDSFALQINWAQEFNLPFVIHCREAFPEVFEVLDQLRQAPYRGIFHAFTGTVEQAHRAIDLGFLLGIGGVLSYKNAGLAEVIQQIPLEHLVLETDAPYLPPVPHRGKRNEPAFILHTAEKLALIHQTDLIQVANITTQNAQTLFFPRIEA